MDPLSAVSNPAESMSHNAAIENPQQLGDRYLRELRDLVDEGKITAAFAQRVVDDMFDAGDAGQPLLKWSVWCSYVEEQQQLGLILGCEITSAGGGRRRSQAAPSLRKSVDH